ncbi:hypothetical protein SAMN05444921_10512 [Streptomyces wuyuanensis]|uniref:Uncharacterized protein n=1 Tax=Streptomyces wuyuanensis TaxID=1196353 RepID=A0A1G9R7A1_9ACTN|nr:hypothetical protein SAMN05444921_10512 [Streptomyces wuyuanensis]
MKSAFAIPSGAIAIALTTSLLASATPAGAVDVATSPQLAAAVVERATGTGDLANRLSGESGSAFTTVVAVENGGAVTVAAPEEARGSVEVRGPEGGTVGLGLPVTENVSGVLAGRGTIVYPEAAEATDVSVQATDSGAVRALVTLKDRSAATTHRFDLDLPDGAELVPDGEGGYQILQGADGEGGKRAVGAIDAPWAKDARGEAVPTSYTLDGNTLVQTVETSESTAFPVVADPKISLGWGVYISMWGRELKIIAPMVGFGMEVGLAYICGKARLLLGTACGLAVGGKVFFPTLEASKKLKDKTCYQNKFGSKRKTWTVVNAKQCK